MTLFTTPIITNHNIPLLTAALNINNFPIKPAVGGMPVNDIKAIARINAIRGLLRPIPAKSLMSSLPVWLVIAIIAKNAARFVTAYATR